MGEWQFAARTALCSGVFGGDARCPDVTGIGETLDAGALP